MSRAVEYLRQLVACYPLRRESWSTSTSPISNIEDQIAKTRKIWESSPLGGTFDNVEAGMRREAETSKRYLEENSGKFSDFSLGDPYLRFLFENILRAISDTAGTRLRIDVKADAIAVLPIPSPNAIAFRIPDTKEHAIIFHDAMPTLLNKVAKIVSIASMRLPVAKYDKIVKGIRATNPSDFNKFMANFSEMAYETFLPMTDIIDYFIDSFSEVVIKKYQKIGNIISIDGYSAFSRNILLLSMETFLCGHELSHIYLGHCGRHAVERSVKFGDLKAEQVHPAVHDEVIADILGYTLMVATLRDDPLISSEFLYDAIHNAAPDVFFATMNILYLFLEVATGQPFTTRFDTHPPPAERYKGMRQFRATMKNDIEMIDASLVKGAEYYLILTILFEIATPKFKEIIREGHEISEEWQVSE